MTMDRTVRTLYRGDDCTCLHYAAVTASGHRMETGAGFGIGLTGPAGTGRTEDRLTEAFRTDLGWTPARRVTARLHTQQPQPECDLALALAIAAAEIGSPATELVAVGELAPDGTLLPLPFPAEHAVTAARQAAWGIILPRCTDSLSLDIATRGDTPVVLAGSLSQAWQAAIDLL